MCTTGLAEVKTRDHNACAAVTLTTIENQAIFSQYLARRQRAGCSMDDLLVSEFRIPVRPVDFVCTQCKSVGTLDVANTISPTSSGCTFFFLTFYSCSSVSEGGTFAEASWTDPCQAALRWTSHRTCSL
jgi:hypothetical protein